MRLLKALARREYNLIEVTVAVVSTAVIGSWGAYWGAVVFLFGFAIAGLLGAIINGR